MSLEYSYLLVIIRASFSYYIYMLVIGDKLNEEAYFTGVEVVFDVFIRISQDKVSNTVNML